MNFSNRLFTLLFLLLYAAVGFAQNNWYWQNPLPQGKNLTDGKFLNPSTGFAVGNNGVIIRTIDGGFSWSVIYSDTNINFTCMDFGNSNTVFVGERSGSILKSTNLGLNWSSIQLDEIQLNDIYFVNETTGYAVGKKIFVTTNSGTNWIQQFQTVTNEVFNSVAFSNEFNGMAVGAASGYGLICRTTNGGINWISLPNQIFYRCEDVYCIDSLTAFIAQQQSIYKTTNGGTNWNVSYDYAHAIYESIYFTSPETGFAVGENGLISRTFDGGDNWYSTYISNSSSPSISNYSRSIYFTDSLHGFITGQYGLFFLTTDGGSNWYNQKESIRHFNSTHFTNGSTGYACGQRGIIMKTTNGGSNWEVLNSGFNGELNDIYFVNPATGFAVGDSCVVLRTTDGGGNWIRGFTPGVYELNSVSFLNSNFGLAGSNSGHILRSSNGGFTWTQVYYELLVNPIDVSTPSADTVFAAGKKNVLKSTNGGVNWVTIVNGTSTTGFSKTQFFNSSTGYVIGLRQYDVTTLYRLLKTTNGGLSFDSISYDQKNISFSDEINGLGIFRDGSVRKTTDRGMNWTRINLTGIANSLNGIFAVDNYTGYIVGEFGAIIKVDNHITNLNANENYFNKHFQLLQNFPNPFNPKTVIRYSLIKNMFTHLKVYDILGNEVATLVNQIQKPGSYEVEFNGTELSSGIYFYKLETGDFTETKSMILLK